MGTRIRDVAAKAGVSVTTASHVLRGYTGSKIKQETWNHVLSVAGELGYRPNAIARSLKNQRTTAIGLYTGYGSHNLRDPFLAEVYTGIQRACEELNYDFLVRGDIEGRTPSEIRLCLSDGKVAGLVVHAQPNDPVVAELARSHLPAVAIADAQPMMPSIVADDADGMRMLVDYLWERGHRHIAYLTSHVSLASIDARAATIAKLLEARGGRCTVAPFPHDRPTELFHEWLRLDGRPTALCCWNDYYAYWAIRSCLGSGIRIPEDFAIAGFDGLLDMLLPERQLVTIAVPWEQMAADAVFMIVNQIKGSSPPPITTYPVKLVSGDTA